jgi:hypothetical protein
MTKREKLQISNTTINFLGKEIADITYIIARIKQTTHIEGYQVGGYGIEDIDRLEIKLKELNGRSLFESRNIKSIKDEYTP